jgi:hypothetical protein
MPAIRHAVAMKRRVADQIIASDVGELAASPAVRWHHFVVAWTLALAVLAGTVGCESIKGFGSGDGPVQVREVVVLKTPFYRNYPGTSSIPFIYLTQGSAVQWLKEKEAYSKVMLANDTSGWVPTAALGAPTYGPAENLAVPESEATPDAARDRRSKAIRTGRSDKALENFNVP